MSDELARSKSVQNFGVAVEEEGGVRVCEWGGLATPP